MFTKSTLPWTARNLVASLSHGDILLNNPSQRGETWDNMRKSRLIRSMAYGIPIPPMFFNKTLDGKFDCIDGKQRTLAIAEFLNGDLTLHDHLDPIYDAEGEEVDLGGCTFAELTEDIQDEIRNCALVIYYFDNISQDEFNEIFSELNNGVALSKIEIMRVKCRCLDAFQTIAKHEVIRNALTDKARMKYNDETLAMQMWILLNVPEPSFETTKIRQSVMNAGVTTAHVSRITDCLDWVKKFMDELDPETKADKAMLKKLNAKTHLVTQVYIANKCKTYDQYSNIVRDFFNAIKKASIDDEYNSACRSGSAKAANVQKRMDAVDKMFGGSK